LTSHIHPLILAPASGRWLMLGELRLGAVHFLPDYCLSPTVDYLEVNDVPVRT